MEVNSHGGTPTENLIFQYGYATITDIFIITTIIVEIIAGALMTTEPVGNLKDSQPQPPHPSNLKNSPSQAPYTGNLKISPSQAMQPGNVKDSHSQSLQPGNLKDTRSQTLQPGNLKDTHSQTLHPGNLEDKQSQAPQPGDFEVWCIKTPAEARDLLSRLTGTFNVPYRSCLNRLLMFGLCV